MHADLIEDGILAGRHRIARLMRDNDLKARQKRRFKMMAERPWRAGRAQSS
jgi:transposase InsO family protein